MRDGGIIATVAVARVDDRRERTRRRLQQAVVELSLHKGFQNLTVENLFERAGVTRATFYSHFRDKDQLLTSVAEAVVVDVLERFEQMTDEVEGRRLVALFEDARRQPDRLRVVLRGEGDGIALRYLADRVSAIVDDVDPITASGSRLDAPLARELAARAFSGQILAVLGWWIELDAPPSPIDVVNDLRTLAVLGRQPVPAHKPEASKSKPPPRKAPRQRNRK